MIVAVTFYPRRLRIYPLGQRPETFDFRIEDADGERLQPRMQFNEPALVPLGHPDTHKVEQLTSAILVGNVVAAGEHINSVI